MFLRACWNGSDSHLLGHVQLDYDHGGVLVRLPTGILEDVEVLGVCKVIRLAGYDPILCLLALHRSQKIYCSLYRGDDPLSFGYDFTIGHVYDIPPLRLIKKSEMGSAIAVDIPGHVVGWLQVIQLTSITHCEDQWL